MIQYWGYPVEEHTITTEDGYILTMHRIPHGRHEFGSVINQQEKTPVYIGHCLLGSSGVFSWGPPEKSIAFILADEGRTTFSGSINYNMDIDINFNSG